MNSFENTKKILGEKKYNRLLEVMRILGIELPEKLRVHNYYGEGIEKDTESSLEGIVEGDFNIYAILLSDVDKSVEELSKEELAKVGFVEVSDNKQSITFVRDGIYYHWEKKNDDYEHFEARGVDKSDYKDEFDVSFILYDKNLKSSCVTTGGVRNFPTIRSYISDLREAEPNFGLDRGYLDTVDNYLPQVLKLLNEHSFEIPEGLPADYLINTTMQLLEDPINELIYTLKNTDQSWRFEGERKSIYAEYDEKLRQAGFISCKTIEETAYRKKWAYHRATDEREEKLAKLAAQEKEYKSQLKLTQKPSEE